MPEARPTDSPSPSDTKTFRVEVPLARGLTIRRDTRSDPSVGPVSAG